MNTPEYAYPNAINFSDKSRLHILFYRLAADVRFQFEYDYEINANRTLLAVHSPVFQQMFFGGLRESGVIRIRDFDHRTFKLFLDVLLGLRDLSVEVAMKVFPAADKYDARILKIRCEAVLMSEDLCEVELLQALDLGVLHNSPELVNYSVRVLASWNLETVLSNPRNYPALTPRCLLRLLTYFQPDTKALHENLINWGWYYIREHAMGRDIRKFLEAEQIWGRMSFNGFSLVDLLNYFQNRTILELYSEAERAASFTAVCVNKLDLSVIPAPAIHKIHPRETVRECFQMGFQPPADEVRCTVLMNGPPQCRRARVECALTVSYTDVARSPLRVLLKTTCKRRTTRDRLVRFRFQSVLDGSLISSVDAVHVEYLFHRGGVFVKAVPPLLQADETHTYHTHHVHFDCKY